MPRRCQIAQVPALPTTLPSIWSAPVSSLRPSPAALLWRLPAPFYLLQQEGRWGCISTKLNQRGLASIDRNNKTTLLFTAPSDITKSYAKVLFPRMVNCKTSASTRDFPLEYRCRPAKIQGPKAYSYPTTMCGRKSPRSGMDSDLEAFSHYPADGSFAALPGRTAAKTNYLNQRFLSY